MYSTYILNALCPPAYFSFYIITCSLSLLRLLVYSFFSEEAEASAATASTGMILRHKLYVMRPELVDLYLW